MEKIKKISDITLEQAREIALKSQYTTIVVSNPETQDESRIYYANQLYKTKLAIESFFRDMPEYDTADPNREMKIFTYIYTKLSEMVTYDHFASEASNLSGYYLDRATDLLNEAASAYGGLVKRSALCSGYSDTLLVLLESQNIKAKIISGGPKTRGEAMRTGTGSHAWNQVCLDGVWYNCDLTNDCDFIKEGLQAPYFLKSNDDFRRYEQYPPKKPSMVESASSSISAEQQEQLITDAKKILEKERARLAEETQKANTTRQSALNKKLPKFIIKIISSLKKERSGEVEK